jgi:hypothetical protein
LGVRYVQPPYANCGFWLGDFGWNTPGIPQFATQHFEISLEKLNFTHRLELAPMSLLKKLIGVLFALVVLVIAGGFLLPSTVHVERDILVDASPDQVFAFVSDFNAWDGWSPWAKLDPDADMTVSGSGLGQTMSWASENPQVGQGSQEIVALEAPKSLQTHLEFGDMGMADATFTLLPEADQTRVVWSLDSDMREGVPLLTQPINTYFGFLMDSMVGKDYEIGLQNLKDLAEG